MRIYTIIILAIILVGCRHNSEANLAIETAKAQMEAAPDSALSTLQSVDPAALSSAELRAQHALLSSLALIKLGHLTTDDSLANVAAKYYHGKPESDGWMKTLYFKADNAHNRGELGNAMSYLMEAKDIAQTRNDIYWNAKITELMSDVFSDSYNNEENAKYALEAANLYENVNKIRNRRFVLVDYALTQVYIGNTETGISIIDSICSLACGNAKDSMLIGYCCWTKFNALLLTEQYSKANDLTKKIPIEIFSNFDSSRGHSLLARLDLFNENIDSSLLHLNKAESSANTINDSLSLYASKSIYYSALKDWQKAKSYDDSIILIQNKISEQMLSESVLSSMRDYFSNRAIEEEHHANNMTIATYFFIVLGILIVIVFFIIHRLILKAKQLELKSRIQDISILSQQLFQESTLNKTLSDKISDKESEINELNAQVTQQVNLISHVKGNLESECYNLRSEMIGLFKKRWNTINVLCHQYFEMNDSERARKLILQNIESEIEKLKDKKVLKEIEDSVNKYMGGIVDKMKSHNNVLKPDDIIFLTLIIAGFSPRSVCFIRDLKLKNFYMKKKRLIDRISSTSPELKDVLMPLLTKIIE